MQTHPHKAHNPGILQSFYIELTVHGNQQFKIEIEHDITGASVTIHAVKRLSTKHFKEPSLTGNYAKKYSQNTITS